MAPGSAWADVEEQLVCLFLTFVSRLDRGEQALREVAPIGLSLRSVRACSLGEVEWRLNKLPTVPLASCLSPTPDNVYIHLNDSSSGNLDCLALQMMFGVPTLEDYLHRLHTTNCLIFAGVKYSCKRYLVANFAAMLQLEFERAPAGRQCVRAHYSGHENFEEWLISSGVLSERSADATPSHKVFVITITNIAQICNDAVFQIILENLTRPNAENAGVVFNGCTYSLPASIYLLGSIDSHELADLPRSVSGALRCVFLKVDEEPLSGLLTRRTRLVEAAPRPDSLFLRAVRWVEEVWLRLVTCLTRLGLVEAVVGPSVFVSCPLHSKSVDAVVKWFISVWNHAIVPVVRQAIARSSSPDPGAEERSGRVSDTAVYVLLQQAVVNGCPLPPAERDKLLGCLHGASALNPPWKRPRRPSDGSEAAPPSPGAAGPARPSRSLPMTPPTLPAPLSAPGPPPEPPRPPEAEAAPERRPERAPGESAPHGYVFHPDEDIDALNASADASPPAEEEEEEPPAVLTKLKELRPPSTSHAADRLVASLQSLKAMISEQTIFKTRHDDHKEPKDMNSKIPILSPTGKKQKKPASLHSTHV